MTVRSASRRVLSGPDVRRLLQLRRRLRDELVRLPRARQREVLLALVRVQHARLHAGTGAPLPPEMTPAELRREIKWRLDAAGLTELEAGARVLDHARRVAAARTRREGRSPV